ncbi:MAG: DNA ligase D [Myxococcota bacterium]
MARSATLKTRDSRTEAARKLETYNKKRDFSATSEPPGEVRVKRGAEAALSYVIQKHAASHLHYDFRLELDGVLLSWAVPKGPSLDPSIKRLAMETEPHPLDYGGFEGIIPQGQYGGGTVMVWDRGSWKPEEDPHKGYQKGHLKFTLFGEKLGGTWHLVRSARGGKSERGWLLFKSRDAFARDGENTIVEEEPNSVISGRSIEEIARDAGEPVPKSAERDRAKANTSAKASTATKASAAAKKVATGARGKATRGQSRAQPAASNDDEQPAEKLPTKAELRELPGAVAGKAGAIQELQLATLVDSAPEGSDWLHEIKFDGYRVLARVEKGNVTLLSRNGNDWTERMPALANALANFAAKSAVLDGEFVALDEKGLSDFQTLQNSLSLENEASLVYYVFDLLHLDGFDLRAVPLTERKAMLARLLAAQAHSVTSRVRLSEHVLGGGALFYQKAGELGLEGIVSKRADAPYRPGRSRDWLKTKCIQEQEFVIVGYTDPGGSRVGLGALLLGVHDDGELRYAGKVGTGFSNRSLQDLVKKLKPLRVKAAPVAGAPTGAAVKDVHWVRPALVGEVAFHGFTTDGVLRHPRFTGLREDKSPDEVKLERPISAKEAESSPKRANKKTGKSSSASKKADESATASKSGQSVEGTSGAAAYPLTNPDKVLYAEAGITKREVLEYYELVAERMLPHVRNRPLTLVRCPDGWKKCFFQKHPTKPFPPGLRTVAIREKEGKKPYAVIDDASGLFALVQLGALEIHTWGAPANDFERPNLLVFDLDPDPSVKFERVIRCANRVKQIFSAAKLETFVKTTGGKGLHVCVPIAPELEWAQIKSFCKELVEALERESPDEYVSTVSKSARKGKIFIDYLRNARGATFIAPYSTRARENAPLAVPLEWNELDASFQPGTWTLRNIADRLQSLKRDPFERMASMWQRLPNLNR